MNAHAQTITLRNIAHLTRRSLIIAVLLAILSLFGATEIAGAETNSTPHPQNDFTRTCRGLGGKPKRVGTHIVKCSWNDGSTWTCDFNFDPPSCTTTPPTKPAASDSGSGIATVEAVSDSTIEQTGASEVPVTQVTSTGGAVVQASSSTEPSTQIFTEDDDD